MTLDAAKLESYRRFKATHRVVAPKGMGPDEGYEIPPGSVLTVGLVVPECHWDSIVFGAADANGVTWIVCPEDIDEGFIIPEPTL